MAAIKSVNGSLNRRAMLVLVVLALVLQAQVSKSQDTCASSLSNLNVCAPFVVPGANTNPSPECCGAVQAVGQDCICNTLRITARLPAQCNLPALNCGT